MTNAKKARQQRTSGSRKPSPARGRTAKGKGARRGGSSTGLWIALAVGAVALIVLAIVLGGSGGTEPSPAGSVTIAREAGPQLQPGEAIPDWSAPALDGSGTISWSDYVGTPTVLSIWAPWCPHCQAELPRLSAAVASRPGIELVTVTTALDQGGPAPEEYMDSRNLSFPVGVDDASGTISKGIGVEAFPTTYFVDSSGNVVQATTGEMDEAALATILDQLATT